MSTYGYAFEGTNPPITRPYRLVSTRRCMASQLSVRMTHALCMGILIPGVLRKKVAGNEITLRVCFPLRDSDAVHTQ